MTADTTFKEFVEENDVKFSLLDFGSPEYRSLVEAFNKAKLKLEAEEDAREHEKERARLMLSEQRATEDLRGRRARRTRNGDRFAESQP
jgi:predicted transposase YdaD